MRRNKRYARNEFRYNYQTKHMNYIFEEDGDDFHSLGLTTEKYTRDKFRRWRKNMMLSSNPKKNDNRKSYIRYGFISQNKKSFAKNKDKRFNFSINDYSVVKSKIRYYKNKRRKRT